MMEIEMFYSLTCPNCKILKRMLNEILPDFGDKFFLKKSLVNSPKGIIRTLKLGIHTVPTLVIDGEIIYRGVPRKQDLIKKLKTY